MKKILVVFFILFLISSSFCFAQFNSAESLTITTYYPSPYGVYGILKLNPRPRPASCSEGELTYDSATTTRGLYLCNSTGQWERLSGGLWASNGANINNTNTGNVSIGTSSATNKLTVAGTIQITPGTGGIMFRDGTVQTTATLVGPPGPAGSTGPPGPPGSSTLPIHACVWPNECSVVWGN